MNKEEIIILVIKPLLYDTGDNVKLHLFDSGLLLFRLNIVLPEIVQENIYRRYTRGKRRNNGRKNGRDKDR